MSNKGAMVLATLQQIVRHDQIRECARRIAGPDDDVSLNSRLKAVYHESARAFVKVSAGHILRQVAVSAHGEANLLMQLLLEGRSREMIVLERRRVQSNRWFRRRGGH